MSPAAARFLSTLAHDVLLVLCVGTCSATPRTFVASFGNDAEPCSRTQPCRSFHTAISHTDAGGEVIVLDSGGYGTATISQSVSIVAPAGVYAGISVLSGNGVTVNGSGINVVLRGLTINGQGGMLGIDFVTAARWSSRTARSETSAQSAESASMTPPRTVSSPSRTP